MAPLVLNLFLVTVLLAGFAWTQLTPGCNVEEGIDYWGNDISGYFNYFVKDMEQCMGDCAKVEQCNFWTYRPASLSGSLPASVSGSLSGSLAGSLSGSLPACWLKTSSSGRKPADWAVSGAKICGGSGSGSGSTCKPLKTMGGVNYTLIEEAETEDWGCSSDCVYQKQGVPSEKWCFKPGGSSVTCGLSKYTEEECPELVAFQKATMSKDEELYLVLKDLIKCCKEKPQASSNETYINQTIINLNETVNNLICNVNHISTTQQTIIKGFTRMSEVMARLDQHGAQCGYKAMWEQAKTIITFDNTFTNDGVGSLDAATGMWTAGVSGTYAISISGYSQHDFRGENMLNLFKNGASLGKKGEWMFAEYGKDSGGRSLVLKLAKDDKLTLKAGDMASATANNNKTFVQDLDFCVFLINADGALTKANTTDWPANECPASLASHQPASLPTVYTSSGELELKRDTLLTTLPYLGLQWEVSVDYKPTNYDNRDYTNILHLTTGGNLLNQGDRTPAIFYRPDLGLVVRSSIGSDPNSRTIIKPPPPLGEWTRIVISQLRTGSTTTLSVKIGDADPITKQNPTPREFSSVKVFASDNFYPAQPGYIRRLIIKSQ